MTNAKYIWKFLYRSGMTKEGIAGLMGNLMAESGLKPNNVEDLLERMLPYDDEGYTKAVDTGVISENEFLHPLPEKQYGYGLAQWTVPGRKKKLYAYVKNKGVSIGDLTAQLEFLVAEMKESFPHVWNVLTSTDNVAVASDTVLEYYEAPADTENQKDSRLNNSLKFFQEFSGLSMVTPDDVLAVCQSWLGLSRSNLSHKPIIDMYNSHYPLARGYRVTYFDDYCDTFVSAVFISLDATDLICGTECGVEEHVKLFQNGGIWNEDGSSVPKKGDIIVFNWDDSTQPNYGYSDHIGLVENVDDTWIHTIEGNMNGGTVGRRNIPIGWGYIRGFAHPKYDMDEEIPVTTPNITVEEAADNVIKGLYGAGEERKHKIESLGLSYDEVQALVNKKLTPAAKPVKTNVSIRPATKFDSKMAGEYVVTADELNVRYIPGKLTENNVMFTVKEGDKVRCYGYYTEVNDNIWLLICYDGKVGHVSSKYLKRGKPYDHS